MKEEEIKILWDKGEKLYDSFLEKLLNKPRSDIQVSNPRTSTLELFALLDKKNNKLPLICAMCSELANDQNDENVFALDGELFENITIRRKA